MSKIAFTLTMFVAVALMFGFSADSRAEMLYYDSYDTSEANTDINFEIDSRTSGTYGGVGAVTYAATVSSGTELYVGQPDGAKESLFFNNTGTAAAHVYAWLDHNFNNTDSTGGMILDLSAKLLDDENDGQWLAIAFGGADAAGIPVSADESIQLLVNDNGTFSIRERYSGSNYTSNTATWSAGGNDDAYHDYRIVITGVDDGNPFDGANKLNVKVYFDGGATALVDYTSEAVYSNNYIGLHKSGYGDTAYFDSLTISKIPEPSTLVLLTSGLIGLLAYVWRKRK